MKTPIAALLLSACLLSPVFAERKPYIIAIRAENSHAISGAIVSDAFWKMFATKAPFEIVKVPYESVYPDGRRESGNVPTAKKGSSATFKIGSSKLIVSVKNVESTGSSYSFAVVAKEWKEEMGLPNPNGAVIDITIDELSQYSIASVKVLGLDDKTIESYRHLIVMLASNLKSVVETGKPLVNPKR